MGLGRGGASWHAVDHLGDMRRWSPAITLPPTPVLRLLHDVLQIWREHQPHQSVFTAAMQAAGFSVEVRRGGGWLGPAVQGDAAACCWAVPRAEPRCSPRLGLLVTTPRLLFSPRPRPPAPARQVHAHDYAAQLPKATWLGMMRSRFWSTFSHCSQQELEQARRSPGPAAGAITAAAHLVKQLAAHAAGTRRAFVAGPCDATALACPPRDLQGIAEVEQQFEGQDTLHFTDRLLFLVAHKPRDADVAAPAAAASSQATAESAMAAAQLRAAAAPAEVQPPVLAPEQRQQYAEQGFTGPVQIVSSEEAAQLHQQYLRYQQRLGSAVQGDWRFKSHLLLPWVWQLAHHPRILGAVSEALGGCANLLCWSSDWFCKQPGDGAFTSWHQARQGAAPACLRSSRGSQAGHLLLLALQCAAHN